MSTEVNTIEVNTIEVKEVYSNNSFLNHLAETILESDIKLNAIQRGRLKGMISLQEEYSEMRGKYENAIDIWEMPNFTICTERNKYSDKDVNQFLFVTWINGHRQSEVSYSFDEQLLIAMGQLYDGNNSRFPMYAHRMLDMSKNYV